MFARKKKKSYFQSKTITVVLWEKNCVTFWNNTLLHAKYSYLKTSANIQENASSGLHFKRAQFSVIKLKPNLT